MSLFVLHGTWSPADGCFFLWGEDRLRFTQKRQQFAQRSIPKHPYQMPVAELYRLVPWANQITRTLILPSDHELGPVASPELQVDPSLRRWSPDTVAPAPWSVTGVSLPPADGLAMLAGAVRLPAYIAYGSDLSAWSLAARFTAGLLARGQFVPALSTIDGRAWWHLLVQEEADRAYLDAVADSLAPVSLALVPLRTRRGQHQPPDRRDLVAQFMLSAVDATIREWLAEERPRAGRAKGPAREWLNALASDFPYLDPDTAQTLGPVVSRWVLPLLSMEESGPAPTPYRTCFLLDPPHAEAPEALWTLKVMLQSLDDLGLLVPVDEVWGESGSTVCYLDHRFENARERLLADLSRAARLFPPAGELLLRVDGSHEVSVDDAYQFLRKAAGQLAEQGMGVMLPSSLERRLSPEVRAWIKTPPGRGGRLGLAELLEVDWQIALGDHPISVAELKRLAQLKAPLVSLGGRWVEVDAEALARLARKLDRQEDRISLATSLRLADGDTAPIGGIPLVGLEMDPQLQQVVDRLTGHERLNELPPPQGLAGELRPYQLRGFSWLAFLRSFGIGACLADDMGLGKTIQVIALLLHEREQGLSPGPALLICPTSLVGNWQRELSRFGPSLRAMVHHGPERLRGQSFAEAAGDHDVVISTYSLSHRDLADLSGVAWACLVLDEAQNIKNAETRQRQSLRSLRAGYRIALTGTPVENRLDELWSLMDFLNPGLLGSRTEFQAQYAKPIERHGDEVAALRLRRLVQPFLLRRVKSDPTIIADLPEKLEQAVFVSLTTEQASLYAAVVDDMVRRIDSAEGIRRRGLVLAALTRLKQICNHPAQFLGDNSRLAERSGKLDRLTAMLEELLAEGDSALVFTQYAEMGRMLQTYLAEAFGAEILFLHGSVPAVERAGLVQRFQEPDGPRILVLTLKAGGVGLNLTRASHVIHFDRWWNPAVENQATDRAYRIGQERTVLVHKLIAAGTVEEKIDALIAGKRLLADRVVGTGESWLTELSTGELRALFKLDRGD